MLGISKALVVVPDMDPWAYIDLASLPVILSTTQSKIILAEMSTCERLKCFPMSGDAVSSCINSVSRLKRKPWSNASIAEPMVMMSCVQMNPYVV